MPGDTSDGRIISAGASRVMAAVHRVQESYRELGRWRHVIAVVLIIVLVLLVYVSLGSSPATTPPPISVAPPTPPSNRLAKGYFILAITAALLILLILALLYNIGSVTLSAQTLAHRRNLLFAFSLIVLTKMFNVDIAETLGIRVPPPEAVAASRIPAVTARSADIASISAVEPATGTALLNQLAMGLLVVFLVYSFIEYAFTFLSDYLKEQRSAAKGPASSGFVETVATPLVGAYRIIFDIALPSFALLFAIQAYGDEGKKFARTAVDTLRNDYERVVLIRPEDKERIIEALKKIEEKCPECIDALTDVRRRVNDVGSSQTEAPLD